MDIRTTTAADWAQIWPIWREIVRAAETCFMVAAGSAGQGIGRRLAEHVIDRARLSGYPGMQFNAVVSTNDRAVALWKSLGFAVVGTIPGGFRHRRLGYVDLHVMYRSLV